MEQYITLKKICGVDIMKRRRKNKDGRSFYMVMSVLCLTLTFGIQFVYNLSEEKDRQKKSRQFLLTTIQVIMKTAI